MFKKKKAQPEGEYVKAVRKGGYIKVESTMTPEHLDNVIAQLRAIRHGMEPRREKSVAPKVIVMRNAREKPPTRRPFPALAEAVCFAIVGSVDAAIETGNLREI